MTALASARRPEICRLFLRLMPPVRDHLFAVWARLGLTPQQAQALNALAGAAAGTLSQRELAVCMGYDPSNITAIVDRLEEQDLVERHVDPADRRVRRLALSKRGRTVVEQLELEAFLDSPLVRHLDDDDLAHLATILAKAVDHLPGAGATLR